jgi:hypothetical protein
LRVAAIVMAGGAVGGAAAVVVDDPVEVAIAGLEEGAVIRAADLAGLRISIETSGIGASDVSARLNGTEVELQTADGALVLQPGSLVKEGTNELEVRVGGRFVFADRVATRRFSAVLALPAVDVPAQTLRPAPGEPLVLRGLVDDAQAVEVDGVAVPIVGDAFTAEIPAPTAQVTVRAIHANGNAAGAVVDIVDVVEAATDATYPPTQGVHVSAEGWADPTIHDRIIALVESGAVNAVQLDIKDEAGSIGYATGVELVRTASPAAAAGLYDPRAALAELDALGVRVIGRIVCFLDPPLASWAWSNGRRDMIIQQPDGLSPLESDYGTAAFVNFAHPDVQQYLIDLAVEAAELGFDEILYDYVRRPEGDLTEMAIPGLVRPAEVEIARFVRATRAALEPFDDVRLGVSVFGIAATRPRSIAQDIRLLAPQVDYVSPMVYPSHWGDGEYGVADPLRQPADIVERSLEDFGAVVAGSGAAVVPWLQAFSAGGVDYGRTEVQAQVAAAERAGATGFLLWNSGSTYDDDLLDAVATPG